MRSTFFTLLLGMLFIAPIHSQKKKNHNEDDKEEASWDVSNPGADFNYKTHSFSTNEGTWMNLDVSPDGQTIVFDMIGDIYS